jgi:predicted  nucleic acid-binding Zn-ribbon protein
MEASIEERLNHLADLQVIDSKIDEIKSIRGELPMEVSDLEDEIAGLETRIEKYAEEMKEHETAVATNKNKVKDAQLFIKKYQTQLENVKNNREYDALSKEIEIQGLEIQAAEKRVAEFTRQIELKKETLELVSTELAGRKIDLENKKGELSKIVEETEKEEKELLAKRAKAEAKLEERLRAAYNRIRRNVKNGIAVATVLRESCSGCFGNIPPQMQADIRSRKKIIVCEHCGRILIGSNEEVAVS